MHTILSLLFDRPVSNFRIQRGAAEEARRLGLGMLHDPNYDWSQVERLPELGDALLLGRNLRKPDWAGKLPLIGTSRPGYADRMVVSDMDAAARLAVNHFREQGLPHMACYRNLNTAEPEHGALEEAFVRVALKALVFRNREHVAGKWTLAGHLDDLEAWIRGLPKPAGVLVGDEDHAMRLLRVLDRAGIRMPEEVALLVYGMDHAHDSLLGLSGIDPDHERVGAEAVRFLHAELEGRERPPLPVRVPPKGLRMAASSDRRFGQHPLVRRVIQRLERDGFERRSVEDIARELGVSKSTLNLAFREATGNSIGEELRRRRLEHGLLLLRTTDQSITEIAFSLGYEQSAYFSRDVKKATGKTPKQVRAVR